ncbi:MULTISPECIES: ABC transporter substrate-binding protein [Cyanophyceae]|uniref:ABC transporter substrate-binding protein n=1 Tax=Cyanophyceae TaxID=3028117 RepID=UPI00117EB77C|nr:MULTISPECIES: ABC transporter substrate-binding protein [Cyanophyceae]
MAIGKKLFGLLGEVFQEPEMANRVITDYQGQITNLKQQLGKQRSEIEVSVIRLYPDKISVYLKDSFIGQILADIGLGRPAAQNLDQNQALAIVGNPIQMSLSQERLQDADGDIIFVVVYDYQPRIEKESQAQLKKLADTPLWSRLGAVKQDQVYLVGGHWLVSGPLAAQAVIDDLLSLEFLEN